MKKTKAWITALPTWLWLVVALFIAKGMLIASIGPAWYGEDEPSHFGYIEALGRLDTWYSFRDNFASIDMRLADRLGEISKEPQWALSLLSSDQYRSYRNFASHHKNATAYQPPLYYWLMSLVYRKLDGFNIVSILYLMRYVNVMIGAIFIFTMYLLASILLKSNLDRMLMTNIAANVPLLSLLAATTTVQVSIFLLYNILLLALVRSSKQTSMWYIVVCVSIIGLLTQQAFMASPIIIIALLGYDMHKKSIRRSVAIKILLLLIVGTAIISPQLYRRHTATRYIDTGSQGPVRSDTSPLIYAFNEYPRFRKELVINFWDQHNSMIPYQSSEKAVRALVYITTLASFGFLHWLVTNKHHQDQVRWLWIAGVTGAIFILGHTYFDFRQTILSGQQYFKARYLFPILPIIIWSWIVGLKHVLRNSIWYQPVIMFFVTTLFIAQGTAISWLVLSLANR